MIHYGIRFPDKVYFALKESAKRNHRSVHGEFMRAMEFYLEQATEAQPKTDSKNEVKND